MHRENPKQDTPKQQAQAAWRATLAVARQLVADMLAQIRGRRIMDARRRRAAQLVLLGTGITLATLALDKLGVLGGMENWFYDQRCYYFQFTTPAPSESLVHVDIDDVLIQATQKWPWPRSLQARAWRELALGGPKIIFLDIVYPESDPLPGEDDALAEVFKASGIVLAPATLGLKVQERTPELQRILTGELLPAGRLTDPFDVTVQRLPPKWATEFSKRTPAEQQTLYLAARDDAARARVREVLLKTPEATLEQVNRTIGLPEFLETPAHAVVAKQHDRLRREEAVDRFSLSIRQDLVASAATPVSVDPPIVKLSRSATHSGFVDFIPSTAGDSRVRYVPLFVNLNGKAFPHVSLVMACALGGVDIRSLEFGEDRIVIPKFNGGSDVVIPTRLLERANGQNAAFVADIPWFGGRQWETMYDVPNHKAYKQHYSLTLVTRIFDVERNIDINVRGLKTLVQQVVTPFEPDVAKFISDIEVTADNLADFRATLDSTLVEVLKAKQDELKALMNTPEPPRILLGNIEGLLAKLPDYGKRFDALVKLRQDLREEVRKKVGGKAVLVGYAATGQIDQYPTPLHNTAPGVVAHGALLNGVLTRHFWSRAHPFYTDALTLMLGLLVTVLVAVGSPWKATFGALVAVLAYVLVNGLVLFDASNVVVGVAGPLTAMLAAWSFVTLFRFIGEIVERNRIEGRFKNYVDPALVSYVVEHPEEAGFAGREKEMTVVFTDLEGFTTLSERLGAGTVAILNDYVARMVPIIRAHNGFLDKFLGDGVMFEFNAVAPNPAHAADALEAVLDMQLEMGSINQSLTQRGLPNLKMRVGINTGKMIVGDAGGGGAANFTVLGDNVNTAARFESANKAFGSLMMIGQDTLDRAGRDRYVVRPLAKVQVKGKEQAVMVYEPLCRAGKETPEIRRLVELTTAVFETFVRGDFEACMTACDTMTTEIGETKFAKLYHKESIALLAEGAGPDFDGRITLSEK